MFIATLICPPLITALEKKEKEAALLLACFAEKKLDEMLGKCVRQTRAFFSPEQKSKTGELFLPNSVQ